MFDTGYFALGRLLGAPVRLHWSVLLGALMISGFRWAPVVWLAFGLLVLLHELGHGVLVRSVGGRVLSIDLTGFGGLCQFTGVHTERGHVIVAWGGVLAQAALLAVALPVAWFVPLPQSWIIADALHVATTANALMIGLNLLPFPPFDGALAWRIFRYLPRSASTPRRPSARPAAPTKPTSRAPTRNPPEELTEEERRIGAEILDFVLERKKREKDKSN